MTAEIIDLAARRRPAAAPLFEEPPLIVHCTPEPTTQCASLISRGGVEQPCGGLLTYRAGRWEHLPTADGRAACPEAEPARCEHTSCTDLDNIDQGCARRLRYCCGCCWILDDELQGRRMWPR